MSFLSKFTKLFTKEKTPIEISSKDTYHLLIDPKRSCVQQIKVLQTNIVEYNLWLSKIANHILEKRSLPKRLLSTEVKTTTIELFFLDNDHKAIDIDSQFRSIIQTNEIIKQHIKEEVNKPEPDYYTTRILPGITEHIDTLVKEIISLTTTRNKT